MYFIICTGLKSLANCHQYVNKTSVRKTSMFKVYISTLEPILNQNVNSYFCFKGYGVTLQPGIRLLMKAAATSALGLPISPFL